MRIIGPNCLGIIVPGSSLNASFAGRHPPRRATSAFISQSGALCTSVLDWAMQENIGFSHFVSIGNMLDVSFGDLIDYFGEDAEHPLDHPLHRVAHRDPRVHDRRPRLHAAPSRSWPTRRAASPSRPRPRPRTPAPWPARTPSTTPPSSAPASCGCSRSTTSSTAPSSWPASARSRGPRLAIVTNAGGPGVMATDALIALRRPPGHALGRDAGRAQRAPAAVLVARQPGRRARRRPARPLRHRRAASCSPTRAWTRCWSS